jgi:hypothetical protein
VGGASFRAGSRCQDAGRRQGSNPAKSTSEARVYSSCKVAIGLIDAARHAGKVHAIRATAAISVSTTRYVTGERLHADQQASERPAHAHGSSNPNSVPRDPSLAPLMATSMKTLALDAPTEANADFAA